MKKEHISIELLKELLHIKFDYVNGELVYKQSSNGIKKGRIAGSIDSRGYKRIYVAGCSYLAHRLIYLYHKGSIPAMIDHIDKNPLNNKIENLRETNHSLNAYNSEVRSNSKCKVKNVYHNELRNLYQVVMVINGRKESFGYYKELKMAKHIAEFIHSKYLEFDTLNKDILKDMAINSYSMSLTIDNNITSAIIN